MDLRSRQGFSVLNSPVYLDYNATTPLAAEVLAAMLPYFQIEFGNPSSAHQFGQRAAAAVNNARQQVAELINANADEIIFTGSATEANNLALLGNANTDIERRHLIISAIEHPAIMAPAKRMQEHGWRLTILPVDEYGVVSPQSVADALCADTALVSVMHANNEIGTIQPIAEIARVTRKHGVLLHTDAAQSIGKIGLDVKQLDVDLLTIAGHKFYAPKGIGALYVRRGTALQSLMAGADQEKHLHPGTENVPAIVALGAAAQLAQQRLPLVTRNMRQMRDRLHSRLAFAICGLQLNGHPQHRLPNTLHLSFPGVSGRALLQAAAADVAASLGSACHSEHDAVSGVLAALGIDALRASAAIRLSVGATTTTAEIDRAAIALINAWQRLRSC